MQFVEEFKEFIMSAYHEVVSNDETPSLEYSPGKEIGNISNENEIRDILYSELKEKSSDEIKIGTSLVGPQRDEFKLKINGLDVRKYASQGQHKTFLIALKIGEFFYLKERCSETPILLLDDIFSELDNHRAGRLLRFVDTLSQTLITSTNPYLFDGNASPSNSGKTFYIRSGEIVEQRTIEA
jgi:DNA replication and repair protein RecF